MHLGLHVSIAGGLAKAPGNAASYGCEVFQIFTRSPRGGAAPALTAQVASDFAQAVRQHQQAASYVHAPYYVNFASTDAHTRAGTAGIVRTELDRASQLGAAALMTHLGSGNGLTEAEAHGFVIEGLVKTLDGYRGTTRFCIELAAGAGAILGATFEETADYIAHVEASNVVPPGTIGVCLDTCHAFAAGYDLRTAAAVKRTLEQFDHVIGLKRLVLIHANDSKTDFNGHRDRHEHIGVGKIGREGFRALLHHPALTDVDFILETPHDGQEQEDLELLKKLRG